MSDDTELPAELSKLNDTYDVLAELHRIGDTPTYLARHKELGRDVTITVVHVPGGGDNNTLTHFASDARLLATMRHPNIIPVLEGRWLDADSFAVVRARVRGSTLEQVLSAVGPMPIPRVADTLGSVNEALEWARTNGVVHRRVSAESVFFQQPTGRVMLALEPVMLEADALPDVCDDTRNLGMLSWEMLTGQRYGLANPPTESLVSLRPELPPMVAAETEAMLHCQAGEDATDIPAYLALLTGAAVAPVAASPVEERPETAAAQAEQRADKESEKESAVAETASSANADEQAATSAAAGAAMLAAAAAAAAASREARRERVVETPLTREPPPIPVAATSVEPADERPARMDDVSISQEMPVPAAALAAAAGAGAGAASVGAAGAMRGTTAASRVVGNGSGGGDAVVVEQPHPFGYNARMITAIVVAAVLLVVAGFVVHNRSEQRPRIDANTPMADTSRAAAGDVALTPPETATVTTTAPVQPGVQPGVPGAPMSGVVPGAPGTGAAPITGGTAVTPGTAAPITPSSGYAPTTPAYTLPPVTSPRSTRARLSVTRDSAVSPQPTPAAVPASPPVVQPSTSPTAKPADSSVTPAPPKVALPPLNTIRQPAKKDTTAKRDSTVKKDTTAKPDTTGTAR